MESHQSNSSSMISLKTKLVTFWSFLSWCFFWSCIVMSLNFTFKLCLDDSLYAPFLSSFFLSFITEICFLTVFVSQSSSLYFIWTVVFLTLSWSFRTFSYFSILSNLREISWTKLSKNHILSSTSHWSWTEKFFLYFWHNNCWTFNFSISIFCTFRVSLQAMFLSLHS